MKPGLILLVAMLGACLHKEGIDTSWINLCPNLSWLESLEGSIGKSGNKGEVYLTHYKGKRVFEINPCTNCTDGITSVYDCEGKVICEFGGLAGLNTCPDYAPDPNEKLLYWKN